jgi:hypothetical protein
MSTLPRPVYLLFVSSVRIYDTSCEDKGKGEESQRVGGRKGISGAGGRTMKGGCFGDKKDENRISTYTAGGIQHIFNRQNSCQFVDIVCQIRR